jgi:hypothetical protein
MDENSDALRTSTDVDLRPWIKAVPASISSSVTKISEVLSIDQTWQMFSTAKRMESANQWHIILANEGSIDLQRSFQLRAPVQPPLALQKAARLGKIPSVEVIGSLKQESYTSDLRSWSFYRTHRWTHFLDQMQMESERLWPLFVEYVCESWSEVQDVTMLVLVVKEKVDWVTKTKRVARVTTLTALSCSQARDMNMINRATERGEEGEHGGGSQGGPTLQRRAVRPKEGAAKIFPVPQRNVAAATQLPSKSKCGDLDDRSLDHAHLASGFAEKGQHKYALLHRLVDQRVHNDVDSLYKLAVAFEKVGYTKKALETWQKASRLDPNDDEIQRALVQAKLALVDGGEL